MLPLKPSPLSDVVISMLTPTPRLPTAACEEQHSAAQGSHGQSVDHTSHKPHHIEVGLR